MAQKKRQVKQWTSQDEKLFKRLVREGTSTTKIARELKRTAASVRSKAQKIGLSLKVKVKKAKR